MATPEWRSAPGYEGLYSVSSLGEVVRNPSVLDVQTRWGHVMQVRRKGRPVKQYVGSDGYKYVTLCKDGVAKKHRVSRLVLTAFVGAGTGLEAAHRDHDRSNNTLSNLEWATRVVNEAQKTDAGRRPYATRRRHTDEDVATMRSLRAQGKKLKFIAALFSSTESAVCDICKGRVWKN